MRSRSCCATGAIIASASARLSRFRHHLHVDASAVREHRDLRVLERAEQIFDAPVEFGLTDADRVQRFACRSRCRRPKRSTSHGTTCSASIGFISRGTPGMQATNLPSAPQRDEAGRRAVRIRQHVRARRQDRLAPVVRRVIGRFERAEALFERAQRRLVRLQRVADGFAPPLLS